MLTPLNFEISLYDDGELINTRSSWDLEPIDNNMSSQISSTLWEIAKQATHYDREGISADIVVNRVPVMLARPLRRQCHDLVKLPLESFLIDLVYHDE